MDTSLLKQLSMDTRKEGRKEDEANQGQYQAVATNLTTSQCVRTAEDRSRWKAIISQVMAVNDPRHDDHLTLPNQPTFNE